MGKPYGIFPQPIWISKIDRNISLEEKNFIFSAERKQNTFNQCSVDKKILDNFILKNLREEFEKEIAEFVKTVICPKHEIEIYITQSWLNYAKSGESHFSHCHPNSYISGVYYVDANEEDTITFQKDYAMLRVETENYNMFNSSSWDVQVETGTLILFPSSIIHRVNPLNDNYQGTRVSLSFNTFIRGNIENNSTSSSLVLL